MTKNDCMIIFKYQNLIWGVSIKISPPLYQNFKANIKYQNFKMANIAYQNLPLTGPYIYIETCKLHKIIKCDKNYYHSRRSLIFLSSPPTISNMLSCAWKQSLLTICMTLMNDQSLCLVFKQSPPLDLHLESCVEKLILYVSRIAPQWIFIYFI